MGGAGAAVRYGGVHVMVQAIKCVLLIDYDSIYRSLSDHAPGAGDLLGARAGAWLEAIENGDIVEAPYLEPGARRRFQIKRCYADPRLLGKNRGWLTANGVQIVDCTPSAGLAQGAANIHLTLDALDATESEPDEIIVLSAETDLTPLLFRLRASNQKVLIYTTEQTAGSYRTFADGVVDGVRLLEVLAQPSEAPLAPAQGAIPRPPRISALSKPEHFGSAAPAAPPRAKKRSRPPISAQPKTLDREALAALVRRIHEVTNVPLFSPRAFADLFRLIAEDVAENGYKFSATTDHVTERMNELGRDVSKRQVGFVIKGLTLRGHVFAASDSAEELATTFYEQVLYLVQSTDLETTDVETGLIEAWIGGAGADAARTMPAKPKARPKVSDPAPVRSIDLAGAPKVAKAKRPRSRRSAGAPETAPSRSATETPSPAGNAKRPMRAATRPRQVIDDVQPLEPAASAEPSFARRVGRNGAAAAAPRSRPPPSPSEADTQRDAELEDSILSAIADAVDVLADDPVPTQPVPGARGGMSAKRGVPIAPNEALASEVGAEDGEADEIGDEIQRILASYSDDR